MTTPQKPQQQPSKKLPGDRMPWAFVIGLVLAVFGFVVAPAELRGLTVAVVGSALLGAGLVTWSIEKSRRP